MILHFNFHMTPVTSKTKLQENCFQLDLRAGTGTCGEGGVRRYPSLTLRKNYIPV